MLSTMIEDQNLCELPTEVLLHIFTYLSGRQLIKCRQVCRRWSHIINSMTRSDVLWQKHCKKDFEDVYKVARMKARIGMLWYNVYRSLALWPMLQHARENRDEFASAGNVNEEIRGFEILKDGIIAVHKRQTIVYYDIETLEHSKRGPLTGDYMKYTENQDIIVIQSNYLHLFVIRKTLQNPRHETNVTYDNVKTFLLNDNKVYFVNLDNEIYICELDNDNLSARLLKRCEESVMCLGYTNNLHILTFERNIYTITDNNLVLSCQLEECPDLLQQFYNYNLLETIDWRVVFQWMFILRRRVPRGPLQEIITVKTYGDIVFVGCNWGVLRIYYKPYVDGEFDFYNSEPVKQYNFMERSDCPVLTMCPIIKVDVLESENGHTVIVGMPKKIAVLDFVHCFKRTASVAMLPYSDVQEVKLLKVAKNP